MSRLAPVRSHQPSSPKSHMNAPVTPTRAAFLLYRTINVLVFLALWATALNIGGFVSCVFDFLTDLWSQMNGFMGD